jgi:hypothetical protein
VPRLTGAIHGPSLTALTRLTELFLFNHTLTTIPTQIGRLTALKLLSLSLLSLAGTVPSEVGNLINLEELRFSFNELDGTLPAFDKLTKLARLRTNNNSLDGPLPAMPTTLRELLVANCDFTALPPNLSALSLLTALTATQNNFIGAPPVLTFSNLSICTLQNAAGAETNCFDCPANGMIGRCFCSPKNAAKCDPTTAPTTTTMSAPTTTTTTTSRPSTTTTTTTTILVVAATKTTTTTIPSTTTATNSTAPNRTVTVVIGNTTTATALLATTTSTSSSADLEPWVVGVIIGGVALAVLLVGLIIFCIFRRRRVQKASDSSPAAAEMKQNLPPTDAQLSNYAVIPGSSNYDHGHPDVDSSDYGHGRVAVDDAAGASDYGVGRVE